MDILWMLFAVFLFILCAILLVIEIFVPSFGLLTLCALTSLIAGGVIFFNYGPVHGWVGVGIAIVVIPIVWIITYKIFPKTSFGKSVTLKGPKREKGDAVPDTDKLQSLLGQIGIVVTPLRPVGMCNFAGKRIECVAETGFVEKDKSVEVIKIEGTQLTVRLVENHK